MNKLSAITQLPKMFWNYISYHFMKVIAYGSLSTSNFLLTLGGFSVSILGLFGLRKLYRHFKTKKSTGNKTAEPKKTLPPKGMEEPPTKEKSNEPILQLVKEALKTMQDNIEKQGSNKPWKEALASFKNELQVSLDNAVMSSKLSSVKIEQTVKSQITAVTETIKEVQASLAVRGPAIDESTDNPSHPENAIEAIQIGKEVAPFDLDATPKYDDLTFNADAVNQYLTTLDLPANVDIFPRTISAAIVNYSDKKDSGGISKTYFTLPSEVMQEINSLTALLEPATTIYETRPLQQLELLELAPSSSDKYQLNNYKGKTEEYPVQVIEALLACKPMMNADGKSRTDLTDHEESINNTGLRTRLQTVYSFYEKLASPSLTLPFFNLKLTEIECQNYARKMLDLIKSIKADLPKTDGECSSKITVSDLLMSLREVITVAMAECSHPILDAKLSYITNSKASNPEHPFCENLRFTAETLNPKHKAPIIFNPAALQAHNKRQHENNGSSNGASNLGSLHSNL